MPVQCWSLKHYNEVMSSSSLTVQIFIAVVAHVINMSILFVSTFSFLTGHFSDFETWTIITIGRMNLSIMLLNSNVDSWHLPSWVVNDIIKQEWNWPRSFKDGKPLEGWFFKNKLKTRLLFKNCQSWKKLSWSYQGLILTADVFTSIIIEAPHPALQKNAEKNQLA